MFADLAFARFFLLSFKSTTMLKTSQTRNSNALETFINLSTYTQYNPHDMNWRGAPLHTMVL